MFLCTSQSMFGVHPTVFESIEHILLYRLMNFLSTSCQSLLLTLHHWDWCYEYDAFELCEYCLYKWTAVCFLFRCGAEYLDIYAEVQSSDPADLINSPFGGRYCGPIPPRRRISLYRAVALSFYTSKNATTSELFEGRFSFVNACECTWISMSIKCFQHLFICICNESF